MSPARFHSFRVISVVLIVIASNSLFSQLKEVQFRHYSVEEGLTNSTVISIVQDKFGFMWFGTEDGLNRFDGYTITAFKHHDDDSASVSPNTNGILSVDSSGDVWTISHDDLERYCQSTGKFIHYRLPKDVYTHRTVSITSIAFDRNNDAWLTSWGSGLLKLRRSSGTFDQFRHIPGDAGGIAADSLTRLYMDDQQRLWVTYQDRGFTICDFQRHLFRTYGRDDLRNDGLSRDRIRAIAPGKKGEVVFTFFNSGFCIFDEAKDRFTYFSNDPSSSNSLVANSVLAALSDKNGTIWLGTFASGLDQFDRAHNRYYHHFPIAGDPRALTSSRTYALYEDRAGAIWIGTFKGGVCVYDPLRTKFAHLTHIPGIQNSLSDEVVQSMFEDDNGTLWVGTEQGGLDRVDSSGEAVEHFRHDDHKPSSLANNSVMAIIADAQRRLWVGTYGGGLNRFIPGSKSFLHYRHVPADARTPAGNDVKVLHLDREGNLWIGYGSGNFDRYDDRSDSFIHYQISDPIPEEGAELQSIIDDDDGHLWIATFLAGAYRFDKKTGKMAHFLHLDGNRKSLSSSGLYCIAEDNNHDILFGLFGGGLDRYNERSDTFENISELDGLSSNYVKGIVPDDDGFLWLSTTRGLSRFDPKARSFKNYDITDGLQGNEFRTGAYHKGKSGKLYFGGVHGLNRFYPRQVRDNPVVPELVLTGFKVFDKPLSLPLSVPNVGRIDLSYAQDYFAFEFVGLSFTAPEKNRYAYKLEGFDKDWVQCGTRRYASYTHLDGGTYTFRVRASNNDGVWNEQGASMMLVIHPPFWEEWWFRALVVLIIAGVPFVFYRYRFIRLLEIERTRSRIARDLHDELSATLSGINFFTQAIGRDGENKVSPKSERFLSLIHESTLSLQESISDIIWSVNPGHDRWDQILVKFRRYASDLFDSNAIAYTIDLPDESATGTLSMERRRNLWLIYKEIVTNTVKHAECRNVKISLEMPAKGMATLLVSDDGKGFDPNAPLTRNGLNNIRSRAQSLDGTIEIRSAPGEGTTWVLKFSPSGHSSKNYPKR